jgi:hypothetical protein
MNRFRATILALVGTAVLALIALPGLASADVPSNQVPEGLKAAITAEIEGGGHQYAGFCAEIDQAASYGKYCAFVLELTRDSARVSFGPVASNDLEFLTFHRVGEAWTTAQPAPGPQVPADLLAAIRAKIEAEGRQFAGLCDEIDQPANVGKYCAFILELTPTSAEVTYGPVLSEPTAHIVFLNIEGRWVHPGGGPGEGEPDPDIPADLRDAIRKYVESQGRVYAGLCTEIAQDGSNHGKYCAAVFDLTDTSATVSYGPVATDEMVSVKFAKQSGAWQTAPRPPASGSGDAGGDTDYAAVGLVVLAGAAVAAGFLFIVRAR